MKDKKQHISIIGLGLLGGSMALAIRTYLDKNQSYHYYGIDSNPEHLEEALKRHIIDASSTYADMYKSDIVIIAVPVDKIPDIAVKVLDLISEDTLVFDVGSTKHRITQAVAQHPKRGNYVAAHPIAGTEYSGPGAAFERLFLHKKNIICNPESIRPDILQKALDLFQTIGMQTDFMDSAEHDKHIAYVSHLSHISSFMLGQTVMQIEKDENNIYNMAGSGFASTVRLAKSAPETWVPIFLENKKAILQSMEAYIKNLTHFKTLIEQHQSTAIFQSMKAINHITDILDKHGK